MENTDEINRYIHVEIMGKCWHEEYEGSAFTNCQHCGEFPSHREKNPDYCSNRSSRWVLDEVIEIVYGLKGGHLDDLKIAVLDLHPEGIATACVEAHKAAQSRGDLYGLKVTETPT